MAQHAPAAPLHTSVALEEVHAGLPLEGPRHKASPVLKKRFETPLDGPIPDASSVLRRNEMASDRHATRSRVPRNVVKIVSRRSPPDVFVFTFTRNNVANVKNPVVAIGAYSVATEKGARTNVMLLAAIASA